MTTKEVTELLARHVLYWEERAGREGKGRCREADAIRLAVYDLENPHLRATFFESFEEGKKAEAEMVDQYLLYSTPPSSVPSPGGA